MDPMEYFFFGYIWLCFLDKSMDRLCFQLDSFAIRFRICYIPSTSFAFGHFKFEPEKTDGFLSDIGDNRLFFLTNLTEDYLLIFG